MLPKWIQDSDQRVIVHKRESGKMLHKQPVKIVGREKDKALFVGPLRSQVIMQEMLDVDGVGRTRQFDADAKGGRSGGYRKGGKRLTQAERDAAVIAHSIEK